MMQPSPDLLFKALADPSRRALFERLCLDGEQTVGALTAGAGISQPAVSKHLGILKQAGLVQGRRARQWPGRLPLRARTEQVEAEAGDVIIFTEALAHGTLPWTADHQRRSILFKYSPGPLTYSSRYLPPDVEDILDEFTPQQRALLEPPYRTRRPRVTQS